MSIKPNKTLILVGILIFLNLFGGALIAEQARNSLQQYSLKRTQLIGNLVKGMVSEILYVFYQDLYNSVHNCDKFLADSEHTLLKIPYIRSISLNDGQFVYCSTIADHSRISIQKFNFSKEKISLRYMPQNPVFPDTDVILLNLWDPSGITIQFGIHPQIFRNLLGSEMNFFMPYMVVNNYVITQYQTPYYSQDPDISVRSKYINVGYKIDKHNYINYLLVNYSTRFITLLIVSVFIGMLLYRLITRYDFMRIGIFIGLFRKEFIPYYQPIIDENGHIHGVEILARWQHPIKGMISPALFIPSAEKSGQINKIFTALIHQVISDLRHNQHSLPADFHLAFNVSAPQLLNLSLFVDCRHLLYSLTRSKINLVMELTERVEIPINVEYAATINRLKDLGIMIALDDFGTGHSSLRYIKSLKIDLLKLDKSFIDMISEDDSEDHIVANILDLAKRINIPVVAEGIESKFQHKYLLEHDVNYFQGYHFSKPLPFEIFRARYLSV